MEPATTAALIGAGSNILSGIGSGLLQDRPERNVRRWSGTPSYPFPFMEGFSEMHPFPGITGPPESSGWQPPQVEQRTGIQHDGNIPLSWIKQAYRTNRPDKEQDISRWFRAHGIDENAEYVTPEQFSRMVQGGFPGMSGVSQGAITSVASDIQSRQRVGQAANQFYAGARGEGEGGGITQQTGMPFRMPDQQGGGSFESVANTASEIFGTGQQPIVPGQTQELPGQAVSMPDSQPQTPVPPMPASEMTIETQARALPDAPPPPMQAMQAPQTQAPPPPPMQTAQAPPPPPPMQAPQTAQAPPPPPMQTAQAPPPPPPMQAPQTQAGQSPAVTAQFPGTDPLSLAPQVAQAVQEQMQANPLQPASENTYVQQLLAALQRDLDTPFVG